MRSTTRPSSDPSALGRFRAVVEPLFDGLFDGKVSPWIYATLRVGLGVLFLVRHTDWLRPWVPFEHHRWVHGLEFVERRPEGPFLSSPFVPFLALGESATRALAVARTGLAVLFVAGVWPRLAAILLSLVSYALLASDRYHYLHHLHLLYSSIAWLALAPLGNRLSLERVVRRALGGRSDDVARRLVAPITSPLWPLQLVRAVVLSVYAASGLSKLSGPWLHGDTLRDLHDLGVVGGRLWTLGEHLLGAASIARGVCAIELALPVLLMVPRTRRAGMALGWALHAAISGVMGVSTFGAEMAILLLAFWHTEADART